MVRKLTAILAADIVGYSKLMGADQEGTVSALRQMRDALLEPVVGRNRGNIVKGMGDGWIIEFPSVTDAVGCAVTIQQSLTQHEFIRLRIGIHTGEVNFENDDVFGDGVNVASRLENLAEPGQILISDTAYAQLDEKSAKHFSGGKARTLKNIARPVTVWKWTPEAQVEQSEDQDASKFHGRTCIAVLPFDNMSGDPEQEYFSDGLTEDIITALSKHKWLEVVARNSVFAYKGTSPNVRRLAEEVGADFVVEGSVRKSGDRIRVTAQLIDTSSGNHVWAERYDRNMEDIFDVQDEITDTIVGRVEPEIGTAVRQKIQQAPRRDLQAWDCYHLGISKFYKFTAEGNKEAQELLQKSR
ncbi:MAG: adenylate/guanylate cyclase domain-containing protein, partial [Pseudomonadota bacterium]